MKVSKLNSCSSCFTFGNMWWRLPPNTGNGLSLWGASTMQSMISRDAIPLLLQFLVLYCSAAQLQYHGTLVHHEWARSVPQESLTTKSWMGWYYQRGRAPSDSLLTLLLFLAMHVWRWPARMSQAPFLGKVVVRHGCTHAMWCQKCVKWYWCTLVVFKPAVPQWCCKIVIHSAWLHATQNTFCWLMTSIPYTVYRKYILKQKRQFWVHPFIDWWLTVSSWIRFFPAHLPAPPLPKGSPNTYVCSANPWLIAF